MLNPFRVLNPTSVEEASSELLRLGERARVYAGGAELLPLHRHGLLRLDYLVNVKPIPGMREIHLDGKSFRIGAAVTHNALETDPTVRHFFPALATAESQVANIRVRHQGTIGGNLCFADPHSDPGPPLLVYGAAVRLGSRSGERRMALEDFFLDMFETALQPGEILTAIELQPLPQGWGSAYLRVHRLQRPTLGVAAAVKLQDGRMDEVRLAVGCVGSKPERLKELEGKLQGAALDEVKGLIAEETAPLRALLKPADDLLGSADYKLYLTEVLLGRALEEAAKNGHGRMASSTGSNGSNGSKALNDPSTRATAPGRGSLLRACLNAAPAKLTPTDQLNTPQTIEISLTVNGKPWTGEVRAEETLLEFLRWRLKLTGTKRSCESEVCGACTVLVSGKPVSSCSFLAFEAAGEQILTIEGLGDGERLDPIQEAFIRNLGFQCGYCTPGQIMAAKALLLENPSSTREEIARWLSGNICRCGCYPAIVAAILEAATAEQDRDRSDKEKERQ